MNKIKGFAIISLLLLSLTIKAQKDVDFEGQPSFKDRVFFGGGLGFSAGTNATLISLSPIVGYMVTQQFSVGVGVDYQYVKFTNTNISDSRYGGNVFARYNFEQLFLHAEYNVLNYGLVNFTDIEQRRTVSRALIGAGYVQPIGRVGRINAMGLYDLAYQANGPFNSPWVFRVFVTM